MTPEQMAAIRWRSKDAMQACSSGTVGTPPNIDGLTIDEALDLVAESAEDVPDLLAHVDHLTAENARLQERLDDAVDYCDNMAHDYEAGYVARAVLDLLNPTEGETK